MKPTVLDFRLPCVRKPCGAMRCRAHATSVPVGSWCCVEQGMASAWGKVLDQANIMLSRQDLEKACIKATIHDNTVPPFFSPFFSSFFPVDLLLSSPPRSPKKSM